MEKFRDFRFFDADTGISDCYFGIVFQGKKFYGNMSVHSCIYRDFFTGEGADKILDYYRASKGAFLCIQKNKRILHYGYIIKQSL